MTNNNNPSLKGILDIEKFNKYIENLIKEYGEYTVDINYDDLKEEYIEKYQ